MLRIGLLLALALYFAFSLVGSDACSCLPPHPQEQYCRSDFVILARVRRVRNFNQTRIYKVRVRKEFKMSEKGVTALKSGRLLTSAYSSMCGAHLKIGGLYIISGNIYSLKAHFNFCSSIIQEWKYTTRRQRKGVKLLYKLGCSCQYRRFFTNRCHRQPNTCCWTSNCELEQGICQRVSNDSCVWTRTRALTECQKKHAAGILK